MYLNPYGGSAVELAVALVNTVDFTPVAMERMLRDHAVRDPAVDATRARQLCEWARRLRPAFGDQPGGRQVALVNDLLAVAASRPYVSTHDDQPPHLHYTSERADLMSRVRAVTAGGLAAALCYGGGDRLGRCGAEGCSVVYVDTSRNGRRRYCSIRCANRMNVAAHRARTSSAVS